MSKVNLELYNNSWYHPGSKLKTTLWYFINVLFFLNPLNPVSSIKVKLLRLFGANIGKGVVIKPRISIKYPWKLEIGDYCWIGEKVWIDNLGKVKLGKNVCISQGAMLLCGNHNYKKSTFDLIVKDIFIEDGVWIGAKAVVCPGVVCSSHSILTVNSVATTNLKPYMVYQGNPAREVKYRIVNVKVASAAEIMISV